MLSQPEQAAPPAAGRTRPPQSQLGQSSRQRQARALVALSGSSCARTCGAGGVNTPPLGAEVRVNMGPCPLLRADWGRKPPPPLGACCAGAAAGAAPDCCCAEACCCACCAIFCCCSCCCCCANCCCCASCCCCLCACWCCCWAEANVAGVAPAGMPACAAPAEGSTPGIIPGTAKPAAGGADSWPGISG